MLSSYPAARSCWMLTLFPTPSTFEVTGPYRLMGVYLQGPLNLQWNTFLTHRNLDGPLLVSGNEDDRLNDWPDDKFADVEKRIREQYNHGGTAPDCYKAELHGDPAVVKVVAHRPMPATVVVMRHKNLGLAMGYLVAHVAIREMTKGNEDQWWAVAVYMLAEDQGIECFPFAKAQ
ncbi:uncharacterized protein PG986_008677 [Apiospora aurea]|uniref:Uncharacterized protein n=1 Tax=Apiospora aurea TaxID=335848 RepID=A0ABR1Q5F9_9PEZI